MFQLSRFSMTRTPTKHESASVWWKNGNSSVLQMPFSLNSKSRRPDHTGPAGWFLGGCLLFKSWLRNAPCKEPSPRAHVGLNSGPPPPQEALRTHTQLWKLIASAYCFIVSIFKNTRVPVKYLGMPATENYQLWPALPLRTVAAIQPTSIINAQMASCSYLHGLAQE